MRIKDLFEKRLLRKIPVDKEKAKKSIEISDKYMKEAEKLMELEFENQTILSAYTSMFHIARALLYMEGIQEKSHYAVAEYLKEKHKEELGELIYEYNAAREQRHEGLYGLEYRFSKEDLKHIIKKAKELREKIKKIISAKE